MNFFKKLFKKNNAHKSNANQQAINTSVDTDRNQQPTDDDLTGIVMADLNSEAYNLMERLREDDHQLIRSLGSYVIMLRKDGLQ